MNASEIGERSLKFLVLVITGYVLTLLLLRVFERYLIFFPNFPGRLVGDWSPRGLSNQDVWFQSPDGTKLNGWWIPVEGANFTFLAFHGNAGNIADRAEVYKFLKEIPSNVLAVEYRGYGKSDGTPSEKGLYLDAETAFDFLVNSKGIPQRQIIAYGQSLGTAVAAHLAAKRDVGGVVLEAPFPSTAAVARRKLWFFPGLALLTWGQFETEKSLQSARSPILVVHCVDDPVIPFALGKRVYDGALSPKYFLAVNGQCHEEASLIGTKSYKIQLQGFLSSIDRGSAARSE